MITGKPEPKIEDIKVDKNKMENLQKILSSGISDHVKRDTIKNTTGMCCRCHGVATKNIIYQLEGASLIEKYCDQCFGNRDR
jgi:hypothetical protein